MGPSPHAETLQLMPHDLISFIFKELAERKANVYATLVKLQEEVSQITEITEILKDAENIKDSKTVVEEIKKEFGVCISIRKH